MFRRRRRCGNGHPSAEASLARAEAEKQREEAKREAARRARERMDRAESENDLARRIGWALGIINGEHS